MAAGLTRSAPARWHKPRTGPRPPYVNDRSAAQGGVRCMALFGGSLLPIPGFSWIDERHELNFPFVALEEHLIS